MLELHGILGGVITVQQGKEMKGEAGRQRRLFRALGGRMEGAGSTVTIEGTLVLALEQIFCLQCHFALENQKQERATCTAACPVSSLLIGSLGVEGSDARAAPRCAWR